MKQLLTTIAAVLLAGCGPPKDIREAARRGNIEAVKQYLAAGTDVNVVNNWGETPLYHAAMGGQKEIAELLIAEGADVNAYGRRGFTPLHRAAIHGYKEIAELLIAKDADVNAKSEGGWGKGDDGWTPLNYAIKYNYSKTADLLRKHGGKSGANDSIHIAASVGNIEAVKQHLAAGLNVNVKNDALEWAPLHYAAIHGRTEVVELLIAKGADVNAKAGHAGRTPLDWAIQLDEAETADLLRKHGGKTRKELEAAELGVSVEVLPDISIHQAAGSTGRPSNIEAIKQYLAIGKDVDARDKQDKTPLQHAAYWGHKEIVELLIAKGADINAKDNAGTTTLDWGRRGKNQTEIADLLRKHGGKTGEELKAEVK